MNVQTIRRLASSIGVKPGKLNKKELVRSIQRHEGNFDCFASAQDQQCDQEMCLWRQDCFVSARRQ